MVTIMAYKLNHICKSATCEKMWRKVNLKIKEIRKSGTNRHTTHLFLDFSLEKISRTP